MAILSPSILSADFVNLQKDLTQTGADGAKWLHVDCMDGNFVPNMAFGYSAVKAIRKITDLVLDVHLMIERPLRYVQQFCDAGADYLTIHVEADLPDNTIAALKKIRENGVKPGIVIKPNTRPEALKPYLELVDMVLVMTVEPGFGGQKFMADQMPKVKKIRQMLDEVNPGCHVEVDGGVDLTTGAVCKENGADVLVAGSAFYGCADRAAFVKAIEA